MKVKEVRILRKFSFGAASYANEDIEIVFDVSKENKPIEELAKQVFNEYHLFISNSDLPDDIRHDYYRKQVKPFRDKQENKEEI